MKHMQKAFALSALLLLFTFSFASAQSDQRTVIDIPFNFTVGERLFTAGKYVIERNRRDSDAVWVLRRKDDSGNAVVFVTRPVHTLDTQERTRIEFSRYDDLYFLSEFWIAGNNTGRQIQMSDRERALDKSLAMKRESHVLIERAR